MSLNERKQQLKTDHVSYSIHKNPTFQFILTAVFQETLIWTLSRFIRYTFIFVSICRNHKAETQASWEDHGYLIDSHFRNNTMLKRQLEKYLRSLPAVSHKPTTSGHSSQTTGIP